MDRRFIIAVRAVLTALAFVFVAGCQNNDSANGPHDDQPDSLSVADIDGHTYSTVKIGEQWWMAENLKVTRFRNGNDIQLVTSNVVWESLSTAGYSNYNNDISRVGTYGRLYNWQAVNDPRGLAPEGWHIPSDSEWQALTEYLGGDDIAGGKMKETGTLHWLNPNAGATNESGFSARPGGCRDWTGHCTNISLLAYFWSVTAADSGEASYLSLDYYTQAAVIDSYDKGAGFSIRCVRD